MSVEVISFGCRLNSFESEVSRKLAEEAGLDGTVIVNTCAVTAEAVRQARQAIRKRAANIPARSIVTGCAAQIEPGTFADMAGGRPRDRQCREDECRDLPQNRRRGNWGRVKVNDIASVREKRTAHGGGLGGRTRAYVESAERL